MIIGCKSYITDCGRQTIWTLLSDVVVDRINSCLRLNTAYKKSYHDTQRRLDVANASHRRFDLPEIVIFGKFDKLCARMEHIVEMFQMIDAYSRLQDSRIEGKIRFVLCSLKLCMQPIL